MPSGLAGVVSPSFVGVAGVVDSLAGVVVCVASLVVSVVVSLEGVAGVSLVGDSAGVVAASLTGVSSLAGVPLVVADSWGAFSGVVSASSFFSSGLLYVANEKGFGAASVVGGDGVATSDADLSNAAPFPRTLAILCLK